MVIARNTVTSGASVYSFDIDLPSGYVKPLDEGGRCQSTGIRFTHISGPVLDEDALGALAWEMARAL